MARSTNDRLINPLRLRMRAKRYVVVSASSVPSTSMNATAGDGSNAGQDTRFLQLAIAISGTPASAVKFSLGKLGWQWRTPERTSRSTTSQPGTFRITKAGKLMKEGGLSFSQNESTAPL